MKQRLAERTEKNLLIERYGGAQRLQLALDESKTAPKGTLGVVKLTAAKADIVNANNRYYSQAVLEAGARRAQPAIGKGNFLGEVDHPDYSGSLRKAAFKHTALGMDEGYLKGEGVILANGEGQHLLSLLNAGVGVDVSTRGYATSEVKDVTLDDGRTVTCNVINDDLWYEGIDFVLNGSNPAGEVTSHHESTEAPMDITKLKAEHADLVAILEAEARVGYVAEADAVIRESAAAAAALDTPAVKAAEANAAIVAAIFEALKPVLPVGAAEAVGVAEKVMALESQVATLTTERDALVQEKTAAADGIAAARAAVELTAHIAATLENYDYAELVRPVLEACATKEAVDAAFAVEKARVLAVQTRLGVTTSETGAGVGDVTDPTITAAQESDDLIRRNAVRADAGLEP